MVRTTPPDVHFDPNGFEPVAEQNMQLGYESQRVYSERQTVYRTLPGSEGDDRALRVELIRTPTGVHVHQVDVCLGRTSNGWSHVEPYGRPVNLVENARDTLRTPPAYRPPSEAAKAGMWSLGHIPGQKRGE